MADQKRLQELHEQVTADIIESRTNEMDAMRAASAQTNKDAEARQADEQARIAKMMGMDVSELQKQQDERNSAQDKQFKDTQAKLVKESSELTADQSLVGVEANFLPDAATLLRPTWGAAFSSDDSANDYVQASASPQQALLTGGGTQNYWNSASGGGWGCAGSGVGEIQSWVEFGFWFYPTVSKFYSIQPLFRYRGFYIIKADDGWFDCKHARTVVSAWVNVYQYNWKGWNSINVLDRGDDNINVNTRFDDDRYTYNSYLLGGGDWAWIRCTIGLYARAQGGGSYVLNDFNAGAANYLSVPQCYVY